MLRVRTVLRGGKTFRHIPALFSYIWCVYSSPHVLEFSMCHQYAACHSKVDPTNGAPYPTSHSCHRHAPAQSWQPDWPPFFPCQHPGIMQPVTGACSTSGGTLQLSVLCLVPGYVAQGEISLNGLITCSFLKNKKRKGFYVLVRSTVTNIHIHKL